MKLSLEFNIAIGMIVEAALAILAYYLFPQGLFGISTFLQILTIATLFLIWLWIDRKLIGELRVISDILKQEFGAPATQVKRSSPSGEVMTHCRQLQVLRTEDGNGERIIHVGCAIQLMTLEGCPRPCSGYEETPPPTGAGALAGMIAGGTIGLIAGPVGVILGGLVGALGGHTVEASSLTPRLEVEIERARAGRKRPVIVVNVA